MAWVWLGLAGVLEVVWALAMKQSQGFTRLHPTLLMVGAMIGSFGLLALAMRELPLGVAYPIWTGIGAVGAFLVGVTWLGETPSLARICAVVLIVAGVVTMKFSAP